MKKMLWSSLLCLSVLFAFSFSTAEDATHLANHETTTIAVSTAEEFVNAIGSNTTILLSDGVYNLSSTSQGEFTTDEKFWWEVDDGKQLVLQNVHNLTIKGESPDCQIVAEPRDAYILEFSECTGITLENITIGHTPEGSCSSGVLYFEVCSGIQMKSCHLFGCGAYGLTLDTVSDMIVENSSIYECTYNIMEVAGGRNISFVNCIFRDIESVVSAITLYHAEDFVIDHCQFKNIGSTYFYSYLPHAMFEVEDSVEVVVKNTSFVNNNTLSLDPSGLISFQNNTFEGNLFEDNE